MRVFSLLLVLSLLCGSVTQAASKSKVLRAKTAQVLNQPENEVQSWISPQWNETFRTFAVPSGFTGQIRYSGEHAGGEFLLLSPWMPGKRLILRGTDLADWQRRQESKTVWRAEGIPFHIEGFQFKGPKGLVPTEYLLTTTRIYKIQWSSPNSPGFREVAWPQETGSENLRQIAWGYQVHLPGDKRPGGANPAFAYVLTDPLQKHFEGIVVYDLEKGQYAEILYGKAYGLPSMEYSNQGDMLRLRIQVAETKVVGKKAKTTYVERILPIDLRTKKVLTLEDPRPKKTMAKVTHK